ncbi:MAG: MlaD family protein, partial [bacterium]
MAKFGTEARLGLVIMTAFLIFIWGTMKVTHIGEARGYDINAVFENASGLETNAPVRMVGVGVGRVKSIFIRDRKAFVTMTINEDVRIDRDASFAIRSQGILGDKYVEIQPGSSERVYKSGDTAVTTKMPVDLESLMESLQSAGESLTKILSSLEKVVASDEGERSLAEILENTRKLSANLDLLISENREDVR